MRYLNLQEGKRRARRLARLIDARDHWLVNVLGVRVEGSQTERTFVRTRKPCSCSLGCGNPRYWEKGRLRRMTVREQRDLHRADDY
jgi:hypothetical protein